MTHVVFRTDASVMIGTGHVMRCLTLASALRELGVDITFITRDLPGHLGARINELGFAVVMLPAPSSIYSGDTDPDKSAHAAWAGVSWAEDAAQTGAHLDRLKPDWLALDHYAFDARWQRALRSHVGRIFVIDDLADRPHDCDILMDQNFGRQAADYAGLIPAHALSLIGPDYALLRPDFALARPAALARRADSADIGRVLISLGGVDQPNATRRCLEGIDRVGLGSDIEVDVVMGANAPHLDDIRAMAANAPRPTHVLVNRSDMAALMARSDLAVGAVGGTTWERCCVGLPTIFVTIADNQHDAARAMQGAGLGYLAGDIRDTDFDGCFTASLKRAMDNADRADRALRSSQICDGAGAGRVAAHIKGDHFED